MCKGESVCERTSSGYELISNSSWGKGSILSVRKAHDGKQPKHSVQIEPRIDQGVLVLFARVYDKCGNRLSKSSFVVCLNQGVKSGGR